MHKFSIVFWPRGQEESEFFPGERISLEEIENFGHNLQFQSRTFACKHANEKNFDHVNIHQSWCLLYYISCLERMLRIYSYNGKIEECQF